MTASTVVFGLLNAVSMRSLPVERAGELALVQEQRDSGVNHNFSYQDFVDFRGAQHSLTALAASASIQPTAALATGSEPVPGELVSGDYFPMLGVRMRFGRGLTPADEDRSSPPVVVVEANRDTTVPPWTTAAAPPPAITASDHCRNGSKSTTLAANRTAPATTAAGLAIVSRRLSSQGM